MVTTHTIRAFAAPREPVEQILLIKPSSLGDIVHALPVVAALKQRWPAAQLAWLVKREWAAIVERVEGVDHVLTLDATVGGWIRHIRDLRSRRWDLVLDLQGLLRSAALGWLSRGPLRVGFANGREGSPWFYTHRVAVPTPEMHAVDRYLLVAEAVGAPVSDIPNFRFKISNEDLSAVEDVLQHHGIAPGRPWVAMSVSARWVTKRWPLAHFAAVVDELNLAGVGPVVVIGSPDERGDAARLASLTKTRFIDMTGAVPLGWLPAFLSKATILLTNDSGPMHIAAAVGTPVVALFGPTSEVRTGPYGEGHRVLTAAVPCRPCYSRVCRHAVRMECLHAIKPEEAAKAVLQVVTSRPLS